MKQLIKRILNQIGYDINKLPSRKAYLDNAKTMEGGLYRSVPYLDNIHTVIDIGASDGSWSKMCMEFYPDSYYILIEALEAHKEELEIFTQNYPKSRYILKAAGKETGSIFFNTGSLFGGVAKSNRETDTDIEVKMTSIDDEVQSQKLEGNFLVKLDTHGYEVPILEGAKQTLQKTDMLVIEAYNFRLNEDSLMFFELCEYLFQHGFRIIDMVDSVHRPKDRALWQMDLFFLKDTNAVFQKNSYL